MKISRKLIKKTALVLCTCFAISSADCGNVMAAAKDSKAQQTAHVEKVVKKKDIKKKDSKKTDTKKVDTKKADSKKTDGRSTVKKKSTTNSANAKRIMRFIGKRSKSRLKKKDTKKTPHYTVHIHGGTSRLADEYQDYTYEMCKKYGIEEYYGLILTQMCVESGYNHTAISPTRNYGLMQISMSYFPRLQSTLGLSDLRDPRQNIEAGVYIMAGYLNRYDVQEALVCYNCGESAARRGIRSNSYSSRIVSLLPGLEEV